MSNIIAFQRPVNGIKVEQLADDGFINGTSMCVAHQRDVAQWFLNKVTIELLLALAKRIGKPVEIKDWNSNDSSVTRLASVFPDLIRVRRGSPANGGGTWIHPKLAVHLAQWCSADFALQVSDWVEEWMMTGKNPIDIDPEEQYRLWQQRYDIRVELRDVLRIELMRAVINYAERHQLGAQRLCIDVHDQMNRCIQGESASGIRALGGLPLGDLIRDYFAASPLVRYSAINTIATNSIKDKDMHPVQAVKEACSVYLGGSYIPQPVPLVENVHVAGKRLGAAVKRKRLKNGVQLNLLTGS